MYIPGNILFIFNLLLCTVLADCNMDSSSALSLDVDSFFSNESETDARIVHGRDAKEGEFPYQVGIAHDNNFRCGGSLISRTFILSAARCFYDDPRADIYTVFLGSVHILSGSTRQGRSLIIHPSFTKKQWKNDIALLGIEEVEYTKNVNGIALPAGDSMFEHTSVYISGWGYTNKEDPTNLQVGRVVVITNEHCESIHPITENNICTISRSISTCFNDIGGPVVSQNHSLLIGITSYFVSNDEECFPSKGNVHTRVDKFREWISKNTGV